jgi:Protein of unknown function (DUF2800)
MPEVIALPDGTLPEHSPLGASSAERWMECPGSVALIRALGVQEDTDEPLYRTRGTAAHTVIERSLKGSRAPWEQIGDKVEGVEVDEEIASASQVFVDEITRLRVEHPNAQEFIEFRVSSPRHRFFYGRLDYALVDGKFLAIRDFKNGVGVVVEPENNPQVMYYAYGILKDFPDVEEVDLGIVQPNAFHPGGPIRTWRIDAEYIRDWGESTLFPAMERASLDEQPFNPGKWCRFCPAKIVCPALQGLFKAAACYPQGAVKSAGDDELARDYALLDNVKMFIKALEEEVFARLNKGSTVFEGVAKLVIKKADRVWKPEAPLIFSTVPQAFTTPELRSPAAMEKLGPGIKPLVNEWAYTPESGLTVAKWDDKRGAVTVQTTQEVFGKFVNDPA